MRAPLVATVGLVVGAVACSLGIDESEVRRGAGGGGAGPGGDTTTVTSASTHAGSSSGGASTTSATHAGPTTTGAMTTTGSLSTSTHTTGTGGASTSSSTGSGAGAPFCGDATCDPSETCTSCPGDCPCGATEYCASGSCTMCNATFRIDVPTSLAGADLSLHGRQLFGGTIDATSGHIEVQQIDVCAATRDAADVSPPGSVAASEVHTAGLLNGAVVSAVYAPGTDPGAGLVAGVDPGPTVAFTKTKNPSTLKDDLRAIASASNGLWMAHGTQGHSPKNWIVYGDSQQLCTLSGAIGDAFGYGMAALGTKLYAGAITGASTIRIATFDTSTCAPCACAATATLPDVAVGGDSSSLYSMLATSGGLYLGGTATDDGVSYYAFVVLVDTSTGAITQSYKSTPGATLAAFTTLATDGTSIFAGGYTGYDGDDLTTAAALIVALPLTLGAVTYSIATSYSHP